jgi:hypothetical protein
MLVGIRKRNRGIQGPNMRRGLAAAAVTMATSVAGCGTHTIVQTVTDATTAPTAVAQTSSAGSRPSAHPAGLGDSLTLTDDQGDKIAVTVTDVMDPLRSA